MELRNSQAEERFLVVLAQSRDSEAFRKLVLCYEKRLTYYIRRFIGNPNEANDVLQEIWLLVYRRLSTLQKPEAFRVWIYKIAHDVAVNHLRKHSKHSKWHDAPVIAQQDIEDWNEFEAMENAELVHHFLEQLSPVHREVLTLRFLEELQIAEIAEITDCDPGTVKSRLHYAKAALRKQIEGMNHD